MTVPVEAVPIKIHSSMGRLTYTLWAEECMTRSKLLKVLETMRGTIMEFGMPDPMHPNDIGEPTAFERQSAEFK